MVKDIHGSYEMVYHPGSRLNNESVVIDFTPPFKRIEMLPTLEEILNVKFPNASDLDTPEANQFLKDICQKHNVPCALPHTSSRLLDKVIYETIYNVIFPTFL